jgi:ABC-type multidrug transport system permease subunit
MHPLVQLLLARLREFIREPEAVFWAYVFPLVMVVALGLAFRGKPVESVGIDVVEGPQAEAVREMLRTRRELRVQIEPLDAARSRLRVGRTELIVSLASGTSGTTYRYQYDPTRPGSVLARNLADDALQRAAGRKDVLASANDEVTEPGSRYIDFLVPGLIGMGLMGGGLWGVGFAIVDMRIRKLLKRFLATPMRKGHFLSAMMLSRLLFMIPEIAVLLLFSRFLFGVVNRGSYLAVALLIILGAFEFAGIGLLVASRAKTVEAVSGWMNLVMIPMWIGSGIFFSPERFPAWLQPVLQIIPLTPLISALRQVMQEGAPLIAIVDELGLVIGWGLGTFVLALKLFRWD